MLSQLRNFDAERVDNDELVALLAFGKTLSATYTENNLDAPVWLVENLAAIQKSVQQRRTDMLEKQLKTVEARLEALKSADEKRGDLRAELEKLKGLLGK